jgi:hypothetical protein
MAAILAAFAHGIMRCSPDSSCNPKDKDGFQFRLTVGLKKIGGGVASRARASLRARRRLARVVAVSGWTANSRCNRGIAENRAQSLARAQR